ncbi:MAG: hypothetical protein NPIRA03_06800 [Nitrospirales bacterium]|nr:MAG: hypothetical protein NPIRA03_06800 [Nitrospirales bacterium]
MAIPEREQDLIAALQRGETVVINLHKDGGQKTVEQWAKEHGRFQYIGRFRPGYGSSRWQNRNKVGTRAEIVEAYAADLQKRPDLLKDLPLLRGKALGCWCAPEPCHGDVLVTLLTDQ